MYLLQRMISANSLELSYAAVGKNAPGFDTLRLLAAGTVVLHHAMALQLDIIHDDLLFQWSRGYTTIGFMSVCIFFSLSGFLVTPGLTASGDIIGYLSRRFMRIMPLLVAVVLATVFIIGPLATRLPLNRYFTDPMTWAYLKNITTSLSLGLPGVVNQTGGHDVNGALWTLRYEWMCYLLLAVAASVGLLRVRKVMLILWLVAMVFTFNGYQGQGVVQGRWIVFANLYCYFGCGVVLSLYRDRIPVSQGLALTALLGLFAVFLMGLAKFFAPALTTYLVACLGLVRWPWSKWLSKSDLSYGIYLLHGPSMVLLLAYWSPTSFVPLFLATLSLALTLALLSWTYLEKPALRHKDMLGILVTDLLSSLGIQLHRRRSQK